MTDRLKTAGVVLALLLFVALLFAKPVAGRLAGTTEVTAKVVKVEQVKKESSGKYLVFTDSEVFEVTDSLAWFRFDSSDLYGRLEPGKTYRFRVANWRVQPLSWYRNVLSADEVKTP